MSINRKAYVQPKPVWPDVSVACRLTDGLVEEDVPRVPVLQVSPVHQAACHERVVVAAAVELVVNGCV